MMTPRFETALITGAGSGIGRAIATSLAGLGLRVGLVGRDEAKLEDVRSAIGDRAVSIPCDVAERDQVDAAVARAEAELGSIGILVCNAGVNVARRGIDVLDPADWDHLIRTNLTGAFNLVHAALPGMRRRADGLVIQVASVSGMRASPLGGIAYSAAKYGQSALGLCLGREVRELGIRSTVIYPGEVDTPILDKRPVPVPPERRQVILQPDDIAEAVMFLACLHPRAHVTELVMVPTVDDFI